jgi:hypothetical protein
MLFYSSRKRRMSSLIRWLGLVFVYGILAFTAVSANEAADRRVQISLPIFPRIVAVDDNFKKKLMPKDKVLLVFLYESDKDNAVKLAESLRAKLNNVAGLKFTAQAVSVRDQLADTNSVPTALFVTERFSEKTFVPVLEYSVKQQRILFSPFVGDVERGATAGISITSRVKPFFNVKTLQRAEIKINPVLMKLSKRHE